MVIGAIHECIACQALGKGKPPATLKIMPIPEKVVNVDYLSPFPNGAYMFL